MAEPAVYDVSVVGGGPAGVAAAVSAAACGARVLLVERDAALGGNVSQALVHTICGLFLPAEAGDARPVQAGFPMRFASDLLAHGAAGSAERAGNVWYLPVDPEGVARRARALCETAGLTCWTGCVLREARAPDASSTPWELHLVGRSGATIVRARMLIDASGDAAAAAAAGADLVEEPPHLLQHPSYIFRLDGVETGELVGFERMRVSHAVAGAVRRAELAPGCESVVVRPGIRSGQAFVTLNVPKLAGRPYAPLDEDHRSELEAVARRSAEAVAAHLRHSRAAFRDSRVACWPTRIGIRETRRVRGRAELSRDDVVTGHRREDEVALSSWPIELWQDHRRARFEHPAAPCSVPLGCLVSRTHPRLGMAGRCVSATHEALGALRVVGTAMATGEAIGVAAALAADEDVELAEVRPEAVRQRIAGGGFPPE